MTSRPLRAWLPFLLRWASIAVLTGIQGGSQLAAAVDPLDWPNWRGPEQNRISRETGLIDRWDPAGGEKSNLLWKRAELAGRSTPIVMRGRLYTIVRDRPSTPLEGEKVICVNAVTGEKIWENRFNVYLSDVPDARVGWSCCVGDPETGYVYALGVCGFFQCLNGETGEALWSHSLHEEFGLLSTYGGRTNVPVIFEDLVIISAVVIGWGEMAKPAHRFMAFDKKTGEMVWFNGTRPLPYDTTYSTPTVALLGGQAAIVFGSGDGAVWAFQPRTGIPIWNYRFSRRGLFLSPLVANETIYMGHSEENITGNRMGGLVAIDGNGDGDLTGKEVWRLEETMIERSSPILVENRLITVDKSAKLAVYDPSNGQQLFRKSLGGTMFSTPLYADGKVYLCTQNRHWYIFKPNDRGMEVVHRTRAPRREACYGSPIVSHGRLYVPTTGHLYCFGRKEAQSSAEPSPTTPVETPLRNAKLAQVQVVPCEVLLKPGQSQSFSVRLFNSRGQLLDDQPAQFSVDGQGQISKDGTLTAARQHHPHAVRVMAKVGDVKGEARVRVVPDLPWKFDFSDGEIPITWVGARYRHIPLEFDLYQTLNSQNPLAAQVYIFVMSEFINTGRASLTYDDSTPRRKWTALLRFLGLLQHSSTLSAQQALDPALELLSQERVIAKWTWDHDGDTPVRLVVIRGPRQVNENGVMVKITTIPKGTRSRCWFGDPQLRNYTVQADVQGAVKDDKTPDIGLIGQGYVLDLQGESQKLQIRTWSASDHRTRETVEFPWEANTWYTMKLSTSIEGNQARIRGKVWPRGKTEPTEWTVEAVDESPNLNGSPGLYGSANNAEIFLDNILVTPNES